MTKIKKLTIIFTVLIGCASFAQTPFKTGVNFPLYLPDHKSIHHYLDLVNQSGGKVVRQMTWADVHWKNVEATDNNWTFSRTDSAFNNPYSITPIGTLYSMMGNDTIGMQTPWLACPAPLSCYWDPTGDSIFSKDYIFQVVNRYKNVTKYWEVANEIESAVPPAGLPNILTKKEFLRHNYRWIKQADSNAVVLLPGLVGTCCTYPMSNSFSWLRSMLGAGAGAYFDVMNYHDYNAWWTLPAHYDSVRTILNNYSLNKPIWVTETSVSSFNTSPITPSYSSVNEQAADVWRRLCLLWGKGAEVVMWHSNWSSNDMSAWGEFGLISNSGQKKKSFHSYKLLNQKVSNFTSVNIVNLGTVTDNNTSGGNGVWCIRFVVEGKNKWVIWSPNNQSYTLNGINTSSIHVTEVVPNTLIHGGDSAVFVSNTYSVSGNSYLFNTLSSLPILVEENATIDISDIQLVEKPKITFYPNPSSGVLFLQSNKTLLNAEISLFTLIGQKVLSYNNVNGNTLAIDAQNIPGGTYMLIIKEGNNIVTDKVILDY